MKKTLSQLFFETISGQNNEGSSKRATAFGLFWLTVGMNIVYWYVFVYSAHLSESQLTTVHKMVHGNWEYTLSTDFISMLSCLGLTAWEKQSTNKKEVEIKKAESAGEDKR